MFVDETYFCNILTKVRLNCSHVPLLCGEYGVLCLILILKAYANKLNKLLVKSLALSLNIDCIAPLLEIQSFKHIIIVAVYTFGMAYATSHLVKASTIVNIYL